MNLRDATLISILLTAAYIYLFPQYITKFRVTAALLLAPLLFSLIKSISINSQLSSLLSFVWTRKEIRSENEKDNKWVEAQTDIIHSDRHYFGPRTIPKNDVGYVTNIFDTDPKVHSYNYDINNRPFYFQSSRSSSHVIDDSTKFRQNKVKL